LTYNKPLEFCFKATRSAKMSCRVSRFVDRREARLLEQIEAA
jgi:hypothetical protein